MATRSGFADHTQGDDEIRKLKSIIKEMDAAIAQMKQMTDYAFETLQAKGYARLADVPSREKISRDIDHLKRRAKRQKAEDDAEMDYLASVIGKLQQEQDAKEHRR